MPYVKEMGMNYPVLQGLGHDDVQDAYGPIFGIPVSVVISRDGKVCATHTGLTGKDVFAARSSRSCDRDARLVCHRRPPIAGVTSAAARSSCAPPWPGDMMNT